MDFKRWCNKLFFLPIWLVALLTLVSAIALGIIFMKGWDTSLIAGIVYAVAFYTLVVLCLACWKTIPRYVSLAQKKAYENPYTNRYLTDAKFKTHVTLYISLFINLLYVMINAISGVVYQTYWFGIFAVYYAIMAAMNFLLARYMGNKQIGQSRLREYKRARFCAYVLLTVNVILSGAVLMMIYFERGFEYQGYFIYVMAMYTFYVTIMAIINMVKYRKYKSPIMSMSKVIKLTSAMFSMLFLETAMFSQFGENMNLEVQKIMIMATGGGIGVIVLVMAMYMIINWTREIKIIRRVTINNGR